MMRASASTQVSIDYTSERDAIDKMRLGTAIGPILAWFFRNTPYFEGAPNPWPLCRQRMWDYLDVQRTNVTPGLYDERFSWEDYAADVLSTPLMFADLTHTPEAEGASVHGTEFTAFYTTAADLYPPRAQRVRDQPCALHALQRCAPEELHRDAALGLTANRARGTAHADREQPVLRCGAPNQPRIVLQRTDRRRRARRKGRAAGARGDAKPYDQPMDYWAEVLGVGDALADVPGDAKWPEVRQG